MSLSSDKLKSFYNRTQKISTKKLHELEYYWRYNCTHPIHYQIYQIVEIILINRGEKTFQLKRIEQINYLNKCFSISNPMGRLSARIIGYICKLIAKEKISNTISLPPSYWTL